MPYKNKEDKAAQMRRYRARKESYEQIAKKLRLYPEFTYEVV